MFDVIGGVDTVDSSHFQPLESERGVVSREIDDILSMQMLFFILLSAACTSYQLIIAP